MSKYLKIACLSAFALCAAPLAGRTHPLSNLAPSAIPAPIVKVNCWDDCWHEEWRSHYRWGSERHYWHNRARSHYRWGSYGEYEHNRWFSHSRWGSSRRYHEEYDPRY